MEEEKKIFYGELEQIQPGDSLFDTLWNVKEGQYGEECPDFSEALKEAKGWYGENEPEVDEIYPENKFYGDIIAEDEKYALTFSSYTNEFHLYNKMDEAQVKKAFLEAGYSDNGRARLPEMREIEKQAFREDFKPKWEEFFKGIQPIAEWLDAEVIRYLQYEPEKDAIAIGGVTNIGFHAEERYEVDYDFSVSENIDFALERYANDHPEVQQSEGLHR